METRVYKLDLTYGILFSVILIVSTYIILGEITGDQDFSNSFDFIDRVLSFAEDIHLLIHGALMGLSLAMIRAFLSVEISPDYIGCNDSPAPTFSNRVRISWNRISYINYRVVLFARFYVFYDKHHNVLGYMPFGVENIKSLVQQLESFDPSNPLLTIIQAEDRGLFLNIFPVLKNRMMYHVIEGQLEVNHTRADKSVAYKDVGIFYKNAMIKRMKANAEGIFRGHFTYFKGRFTIRVLDHHYGGEVEVDLPMKNSKRIFLKVRRV